MDKIKRAYRAFWVLIRKLFLKRRIKKSDSEILPAREFWFRTKAMTKNDLIKEIHYVSQEITKMDEPLSPKFKKELRTYSKRKLRITLFALTAEKSKRIFSGEM